jgi:DNA-binding transcriptional ArsR family regulator
MPSVNDHEKEARIFKVLSVGTRLRIIALLKRHALCVNALARALKITPAAVSQHLRVLRDAGIVTAEKRGYYVHYRVNDDKLWELGKMIMRLLKKVK